MPKIAISYRRQDSEAITGRIFDRLVAQFGKDAVFRDIDNIPLGVDFRDYIHDALTRSDVLLAIIGPLWAGPLANGRTRLDEETDLVRIEVQTALSMNIAVIPVLIANGVIPGTNQLPDGIKDIAFRNAIRIDAGQDFDHHMSRLIQSIQRYFESKGLAPVEPRRDSAADTVVSAPASVSPPVAPEPSRGEGTAAPMPEPPPPPRWEESQHFGVTVATVRGRVDNDTSGAFQEKLLAALAQRGSAVLMDFSDVEFISSAGMAALMTAAKRARSNASQVAIAALTPIVHEIFQISRFTRVVTVYTTLDEGKDALARFVAGNLPPTP